MTISDGDNGAGVSGSFLQAPQDDRPLIKMRPCSHCGEDVPDFGAHNEHYVSGIGHDTPPEDFGLYPSYWTCQPLDTQSAKD